VAEEEWARDARFRPRRGVSRGAAPSSSRNVEPVLALRAATPGPATAKRVARRISAVAFGFDPELDYRSLTMDLSGRRLNRMEPDRRPVPSQTDGRHSSRRRRRLDPNGPAVRDVAHHWIRGGSGDDAMVKSRSRGLASSRASACRAERHHKQLIVTARYSDGSFRDVTHLRPRSFRARAPSAPRERHGPVKAGRSRAKPPSWRASGQVATARHADSAAGGIAFRVPHEVYACAAE
jgi:hypothetical protein